MKKITEEHFCDYCGKDISKYVPFEVHPTFRNKDKPKVVFCITSHLGGSSACYDFWGEDFCSKECFVKYLATFFSVKITIDSESKDD